MNTEQYLKEKQHFIFELDNVIYPEKDYFLQVYYLFAQFIAYSEQLSEANILSFMQKTYLEEGKADIFNKTAKEFNIPEKYQVNFDMLLHSVRLPLKLLIFNDVLNFLQEIVLERKQLFLFVQGNPTTQLNKIKQIEWNGLEKYLTVYFAEEFENQSDALRLIVEQHALKNEDILLIGNSLLAEINAANNKVDYLTTDNLFVR